jgi:acyl-CoA thioester hydrolase
MARTLHVDIPVRWGDLDAFDHVNNTVFMRYVEEARIQFFATLGDEWLSERIGPVIVNINCNFRREIKYPATVRVSVSGHAASEKRLVMSHQLTDADNPEILYGDAEVTALWVDAEAGRSVPLPAPVLAALEAD